MSCYNQAFMVVDTSAPGWRILHVNESLTKQTGMTPFRAIVCLLTGHAAMLRVGIVWHCRPTEVLRSIANARAMQCLVEAFSPLSYGDHHLVLAMFSGCESSGFSGIVDFLDEGAKDCGWLCRHRKGNCSQEVLLGPVWHGWLARPGESDGA